jgi:hydroxymethylbilane synthase
LRLGTRGSALALAQAESVAAALRARETDVELVPIKTSGDTANSAPGDKSRFVKEIEDALLSGAVDVAVHSAKDVPGRLPDGLAIAAVPAGEDPRDALVGAAGQLAELPAGSKVGTTSLRRRAQLLAINRELEVLPLRGNVDTRLRKLATGDYDAIVLACAGLRRLGRADEIAAALDVERFVPAPGQGLLVLETRAEDRETVAALEDPEARRRLEAERALVTELDASCHTPVGAHARIEGDRLHLHAFVGLPDGSEWITDRWTADAAEPRAAGRELAQRMLSAGAGELLRKALYARPV